MLRPRFGFTCTFILHRQRSALSSIGRINFRIWFISLCFRRQKVLRTERRRVEYHRSGEMVDTLTDVRRLSDMSVENLKDRLRGLCDEIVKCRMLSNGNCGDSSRPLATWPGHIATEMVRPKKISVRQQLQGHYGKIYALHWSQQVSIYDVDTTPCAVVR